MKKLLFLTAVSLLVLTSTAHAGIGSPPAISMKHGTGHWETDWDINLNMACGDHTWVRLQTDNVGPDEAIPWYIEIHHAVPSQPDEVLITLTATGGALLYDAPRQVDGRSVAEQGEAGQITVRRWDQFWGTQEKEVLVVETNTPGVTRNFQVLDGVGGDYFNVRLPSTLAACQASPGHRALVRITASITGRVDNGVTTTFGMGPLARQYAHLVSDMRKWAYEESEGQDHVNRWRRVLVVFGDSYNLAPMTATEAQGYADRGLSRWKRVAPVLRAIEGVPQRAQSSPESEDNDDPVIEFKVEAEADPHADLIAAVRGYAAEGGEGPEHVKRWQRALKALGETDAAFAGLDPMTAAEAQGYADKGWSRWEPVAAALTKLESVTAQAQASPPPSPEDRLRRELAPRADCLRRGDARDARRLHGGGGARERAEMVGLASGARGAGAPGGVRREHLRRAERPAA